MQQPGFVSERCPLAATLGAPRGGRYTVDSEGGPGQLARKVVSELDTLWHWLAAHTSADPAVVLKSTLGPTAFALLTVGQSEMMAGQDAQKVALQGARRSGHCGVLAGQGRAGQGRAGQGGRGRAGQGRAGGGGAEWGGAGWGMAGGGRAGWGRAGQAKEGQDGADSCFTRRPACTLAPLYAVHGPHACMQYRPAHRCHACTRACVTQGWMQAAS